MYSVNFVFTLFTFCSYLFFATYININGWRYQKKVFASHSNSWEWMGMARNTGKPVFLTSPIAIIFGVRVVVRGVSFGFVGRELLVTCVSFGHRSYGLESY